MDTIDEDNTVILKTCKNHNINCHPSTLTFENNIMFRFKYESEFGHDMKNPKKKQK